MHLQCSFLEDLALLILAQTHVTASRVHIQALKENGVEPESPGKLLEAVKLEAGTGSAVSLPDVPYRPVISHVITSVKQG